MDASHREDTGDLLLSHGLSEHGGSDFGRDIMNWIIEVLINEAYLIRVYIIKSTIIAIINVS